jgi:hypothetical protein
MLLWLLKFESQHFHLSFLAANWMLAAIIGDDV